jgi:hypothetical protein
MSTKPNNASVIDVCTKRLQALKTYAGQKGTIPVNGKEMKISDVVGIYQDCLDSRAQLSSKRSEVKTALAARENAESARAIADVALQAWVTQKFGVGSQQALDFGFAPRKRAQRTTDEKANAVALGLATRKARNTMGKKQKKSIKGALAVPTAPAAPAINTPAGASTAGQPAVVVVQAAPAQQPQPLNGASASVASTATANGAPASH